MHLRKPTHAQSIRIKAKFHDYVRKKKNKLQYTFQKLSLFTEENCKKE